MKNIKYYYIILMQVLVFSLSSQTNLVCNGNFEKYNEDTYGKIKSNRYAYLSHFIPMKYEILVNPEEFDPYYVTGTMEPLFNHWERYTGPDNDNNTINDAYGIEYGIIPDLYSTGIQSAMYTSEPEVYLNNNNKYSLLSNTSSRIYYNNSNELILDPPYFRFANLAAEEGLNFVALIDFETENNLNNFGTVPGISSKLKEPLREGIAYILRFDIAKMPLNQVISTQDDWDDLKMNNLSIDILFMDDNGNKQDFKIDFDETYWNTRTEEFIADRAYTKIGIRFNPIEDQLLDDANFSNTKIAGCFIDNISVYEKCDHPDIMCNNASYRGSMEDVSIKETQIYSDKVILEDGSTEQGNRETIKVTHLDNVKEMELVIQRGTSEIINVITLHYPPSTFYWDGRDQDGNPAPDGNNYFAKITHLKNDCYELFVDDTDHKNFDLTSHFTYKYSVTTEINPTDGNLIVRNLDDVHELKMEILSNGSTVRTKNFYHPASEIAIDFQPFNLASGIYDIKLTLSNNCGTGIRVIQNLILSLDSEPDPLLADLYNWVPEDKTSQECYPFDETPLHNYLPPKNCCEGNLYIFDVDIYNSFDVNIMNTIYIFNDVTISHNSTINFNAGDGIIIDPEELEAEIKLNPGVTLTTGNYSNNCADCIKVNTTLTEDKEELTLLQNLSEDTLKKSTLFYVYPNPLVERSVKVKAGRDKINPLDYELVLFNSKGEQIAFNVNSVTEEEIEIIFHEDLSAGSYFLNFRTGEHYEHFKIQKM